jgi:CubicO group peptidase (beta-lactamase class C family)
MNDKVISRTIESEIKKGSFPGCVLLVGINDEIVIHKPYGLADIYTEKKMIRNTVFDLASLTKPLATSLCIAHLIDYGKLSLDQPLGSLIDEFRSTDKADITIDMLLRHTSGLPAYIEYYKQITSNQTDSIHQLRALLLKQSLENTPDLVQNYSDLGFMILSWIIERVSGTRVDEFSRTHIYEPLGIRSLFFIDLLRDENIRIDKSLCFAATQNCPWRKKMLIGEVDDDNTWAVGGVDGHAGLFGDALGVHLVCRELLKALNNRSAILPNDIIQALVAKKGKFEMVAGFDTPAKRNSSAGRFFSSRSIGHLGFTGTSFWIDPDTTLIVVFLTNRVHPNRENDGIKKFRPKLHDIIASELL